jgi:hypothetical protein
MNITDYTFKIGDLATIHEGKIKDLNIDLSPNQEGQLDPEMILEADAPTLEGEAILVEPNDFILLPTVMMTVMIAPKRAIGKPFKLLGYLIKLPSSIVMGFGVKYIRYKLTIEMHRLMLETHRFAFQSVISLEQIAKMRLSLLEEEAKVVNADASIFMKQIEQATAKAIFAHKSAIELWKAAITVLTPNDQHWN